MGTTQQAQKQNTSQQVYEVIKDNRLRQNIITGALLALFLGIALYFRIAFPYHLVFGGEQVKFTGVDAWWHMSIVDNLVHNFPHLNSFDPYMLFPGGSGTSYNFPFFDYLLAGIIWLIGLGSPTEHTVNVVAAYFPAIMGALTVIPVYFIGKTLFNRWAGIISAGLIAILPGEFLWRSILGFTDHHVAETFFTTTAMLFLLLAIKNSKREQLTLAHFRHPYKTSIAKPMIYSLLAGIFLGIYLISWEGALLFVFIITAYFLIQFIIDHLRQKPVDYLCLVGIITLLTALVISAPINRDKLYLASLVIALIVPIALATVSRLMSRRKLSPSYYPLALLGVGLATLGILYATDSYLLKSMMDQLGIFSWHTTTTVQEMEPLLLHYGSGGGISLIVVWGNFTISFFLSIIALGILIYLIIKQGEANKTLVVVWTVVILAVTLAQRRFNYYLAVNVALLTGYLCWQVLRFAASQGRAPESATKLPPPKRKKGKAKPKKFRLSDVRIPARWVYVTLTAIVLFFMVFFPNISKARATASQDPAGAPSDAWYESLVWLRDNTPEPFGDPEFYYERYTTPFEYPETAYGVTAWWDYGYWITRIAHRIPSQNPGGHATPQIASLFVAQDEASASAIMDSIGSRYFVADYGIATGKFYAAVTLSGGNVEDFYDVFYSPQQDAWVTLYFPEYYRSLCVRLYNFGGEAVTPKTCIVISWQLKRSQQNTSYKEITGSQEFATYGEALAYMAKQTSGNYQIVSSNPFASPIPLDKLEHFRLVHDSESTVTTTIGPVPEVRVFEYEK